MNTNGHGFSWPQENAENAKVLVGKGVAERPLPYPLIEIRRENPSGQKHSPGFFPRKECDGANRAVECMDNFVTPLSLTEETVG